MTLVCQGAEAAEGAAPAFRPGALPMDVPPVGVLARGVLSTEAPTGDSAETMPVAERFVSINGEGPRAGRTAAFIRFVGCNLSCSWCDTVWATAPNCPHEDASVADLVAWVVESDAACVTLTGGEPVLQPLLPSLIEALAASDAWGCGSVDRVIEVETNGSVDLSGLDALRRRLAAASACGLPCRIAFTVDCKLPASGMAGHMLPENRALLGPGDAVKFVAASPEDLACARDVIRDESLCDRSAVFLSPVFGRIDPADIVAFMRAAGLPDVRLQLQLHKIIWPGEEKGV